MITLTGSKMSCTKRLFSIFIFIFIFHLSRSLLLKVMNTCPTVLQHPAKGRTVTRRKWIAMCHFYFPHSCSLTFCDAWIFERDLMPIPDDGSAGWLAPDARKLVSRFYCFDESSIRPFALQSVAKKKSTKAPIVYLLSSDAFCLPRGTNMTHQLPPWL